MDGGSGLRLIHVTWVKMVEGSGLTLIEVTWIKMVESCGLKRLGL